MGTHYGIDVSGKRWRLPEARDIVSGFREKKGNWFRVTRIADLRSHPEEEQTALVQLTKRHKSGQQLVLRAQIVLAAGEGQSNVKIAQELSVSVETVRLWRNRWVAGRGIALKERGVEERLADAFRPGAPARISAEQ